MIYSTKKTSCGVTGSEVGWGKKRLRMDMKYNRRAGKGCKIVKILVIFLLY
jgi:hypothetical protein